MCEHLYVSVRQEGTDIMMEECDAVVEIPVFGVKNSLNVACCASVALYEVLRRWGKWESRVER